MPTLSGVRGGPRPRNTSRTSGTDSPSSRIEAGMEAPSLGAQPGDGGRSRRTEPGRRRKAASRARERAPPHRGRRCEADRRDRCRGRDGSTTARRSGASGEAVEVDRRRGRGQRGRRRSGESDTGLRRGRRQPTDARSRRSLPWARTRLEREASSGRDHLRRRRRRSRAAGSTTQRSPRWRPRTLRHCVPMVFVAADLADVLAGGGLQFAGRRGRFRATEGLDASAHGGRVQRGPSALLPSPRQRLI